MKIRSLASALTLVLIACQKPPAMSFERPPAPVVVTTVVAEDVPRYLDEVGKCVAREVVTVKPQISGQITQIHFVDGAEVKAGDPLFTIDPRPFKAKLEADEAMLTQAQAKLELAKNDWTRLESISDPRAISKQERDSKKNAVQVAEADIKHSQANLEMSRLNLEYCSIKSPIAGRTSQRMIDLGNIVNANDSALVMVQRFDPIYADFVVPENELRAVQQNMQSSTLKVEVRLPEAMNEMRGGELTFLGSAVQEGTGTVKLRATIANQDRYFWPGRFVKVRLILNTLSGALLIPASAPQMSPKGYFVYVVKEDSTAEFRPVTLGQRHGDKVVIEQGLKPGEKIIVQGQIGVMPGGKVQAQS